MEAATTTDQLAEYVVRLADDALIYGQRLSQWCSHAPTLEEDLALANVALDYLGRARLLYACAGARTGISEDDYAFARDTREFTNLLLLELPNGDFARTMVRQYLLDEFEWSFLAAMARVADDTLSAIAHKSLKETEYHLRRSREWMMRLGLGTDESHRRAEAALKELWGYMPELFIMDELEKTLYRDGLAVSREDLQEGWLERVATTLSQAGLSRPESTWQVVGGRQGVHTEHMGHLLAEMQFMQRAYPGLEW